MTSTSRPARLTSELLVRPEGVGTTRLPEARHITPLPRRSHPAPVMRCLLRRNLGGHPWELQGTANPILRLEPHETARSTAPGARLQNGLDDQATTTSTGGRRPFSARNDAPRQGPMGLQGAFRSAPQPSVGWLPVPGFLHTTSSCCRARLPVSW